MVSYLCPFLTFSFFYLMVSLLLAFLQVGKVSFMSKSSHSKESEIPLKKVSVGGEIIFFLDFWKGSLKNVLNKFLAKFIHSCLFGRQSTIVLIVFTQLAVLPNIPLRASFRRLPFFPCFLVKGLMKTFNKSNAQLAMQVKQFEFTF